MNTQTTPSQSPSVARQTGPALEAHYPFLLWLIPTLGFMGTVMGIAFALHKQKRNDVERTNRGNPVWTI